MSNDNVDPRRALAEALALQQSGQWAAAEQACRQVLRVRPAEPTALHVLGVCLLQRGEYAGAEQALAACLQAQPGEPAALANRGIALQALGRFDEALACYAQALARAPQQPATLNMQGLALMELKRFDEALASFEQAVAVAPQFAEAWCSRANALIHLRRYAQALESLDRAEALRPEYGEALSNRAIVLNLLGRHDQALTAAQRAAALLPEQATVHRNLADALAGLARYDEACQQYDRAVALAAEDHRLLVARADLLASLGRDTDATADYRRALAMIEKRLQSLQRNENVIDESGGLRRRLAGAFYERGLVQVDLSLHGEAIESFAQATALLPDFADAHWAESLNRLRLGDYEQGWCKYEWRRRTQGVGTGLRHFDEPQWFGAEDPAGLHILLHAEQGLGDTLQFCRYAPLLAERGARVTLLAPPALKRLLASLAAIKVIADGETLPDFDRHCPLLSLPLAFRTTLSTVPAKVPYLQPDAEALARWCGLLGKPSRLRVGLVWSGNSRHAKDRERSFPLSTLAPFFDLDVEFFGLNKEVRSRDRGALQRFPVRTFEQQIEDFTDTAALIECLDLVITVDTAVAHLAGALGKPVWILLDARPDFRWMLQREDSPWYPSARLFRQSVPGNWHEVVERVARALKATGAVSCPASPRVDRSQQAAPSS